eukprot:2836860-Rhodomonas_salina.1
MSGTKLGYAATRCTVLFERMLLPASYAPSGTELGYAATRRRFGRYWQRYKTRCHTLCPYCTPHSTIR